MSRRAVSIASGVGVLFTSLMFVHVVHHAFVHRGEITAGALVTWLIPAVAAGILSFIGAYLLLTGGRPPKL